MQSDRVLFKEVEDFPFFFENSTHLKSEYLFRRYGPALIGVLSLRVNG